MDFSIRINSFKKLYGFLSNIPVKTVNVLLLKVISNKLTILYYHRNYLTCYCEIHISSSLTSGEEKAFIIPSLSDLIKKLHEYKASFKGEVFISSIKEFLHFNSINIGVKIEPRETFTFDYLSDPLISSNYNYFDKIPINEFKIFKPIHKLLKVCNRGFSISQNDRSSFFYTLIGEHIGEDMEVFLNNSNLPHLSPVIREVRNRKNRNPIPCIGFTIIKFNPDYREHNVDHNYYYIKQNLE